MESDTSYDVTDLSQQFVVAGIGDSANLIGFYENDRFSIRVAYNWRDDFLAGTGQANVGGIPRRLLVSMSSGISGTVPCHR